MRRIAAAVLCGGLMVLGGASSVSAAAPRPPWYFAVSGDSRDCGDLIMPKIAHAIAAGRARTPVAFYWHLGDFRRMFDVDCDILVRRHPQADCNDRPADLLAPTEMNDYLDRAWDDFIARQLKPFGDIRVVLGIGNHELLAGRTREDFQRTFQRWLTQDWIHAQRIADGRRGLRSTESETYYHFVKNGVDFIYLDNADQSEFAAPQIAWLAQVLAQDERDPAVKTIVAGMHAALPFSTASSHAMDASCQGICSGAQVYDMLYGAQRAAGSNAKHVYVFASHSHYFEQRIFDTPAHAGRVLPGWIVGTAGAEQYKTTIEYGYVLAAVADDGTLDVRFEPVTRGTPPLASGDGASRLTTFCFEDNKKPGGYPDTFKGMCACGAAR